jgi:hypothetical protein
MEFFLLYILAISYLFHSLKYSFLFRYLPSKIHYLLSNFLQKYFYKPAGLNISKQQIKNVRIQVNALFLGF